MKKIHTHLIFAVLTFSCLLTPSVVPTPATTPTNVPTDIPSSTLVTPTLTFTNTPTLIGIRTDTPTSEFTLTPDAVASLFLFTPNTATPSPQMKGFISVNVSEKEFYKGGPCQPTTVKFSAQVLDIQNTPYVDLFVRLKSKQASGVTSEWTRIKMETIGAGTFLHDLTAAEIKGGITFQNPWVQYQYVASQANGREVGRTDIFSERLSLLECIPTPTLTLSPTPTVLKP